MFEWVKNFLRVDEDESRQVKGLTRIAQGAALLNWGFMVPAWQGDRVSYILVGDETMLEEISAVLDKHFKVEENTNEN